MKGITFVPTNRMRMDHFEVQLLADSCENGVRKTVFAPCAGVCSERIEVETEGDVICRVQFTKGCHGNTQGVARLCIGRKVGDVIALLEGIDCKGRGTSCPDQLARALKQL